jgi:hypothetical protein
MLHLETVEPSTLDIIKRIQGFKEFENLRLVGGTGLALHFGHRISVDIDLFGDFSCDDLTITKLLNKVGQTSIINQSTNIKIFQIKGVKTDIVNYHYPWLKKAVSSNGIFLADVEDIAAMKLSAITGRGTKKDFIDLFFLLKKFTLKDMLSMYLQKYQDGSEFLVVKSLAYFDDAEQEDNCQMLIDVNWKEVKAHIINEVQKYIKS